MQGGGIRHHTRHLGIAHVQRNDQGGIELRHEDGARARRTQVNTDCCAGSAGDRIDAERLEVAQIEVISAGHGQTDDRGRCQSHQIAYQGLDLRPGQGKRAGAGGDGQRPLEERELRRVADCCGDVGHGIHDGIMARRQSCGLGDGDRGRRGHRDRAAAGVAGDRGLVLIGQAVHCLRAAQGAQQ